MKKIINKFPTIYFKKNKAYVYILRSAKYNEIIYFVLTVKFKENIGFPQTPLLLYFLCKSFLYVSQKNLEPTDRPLLFFVEFFSQVNNKKIIFLLGCSHKSMQPSGDAVCLGIWVRQFAAHVFECSPLHEEGVRPASAQLALYVPCIIRRWCDACAQQAHLS